MMKKRKLPRGQTPRRPGGDAAADGTPEVMDIRRLARYLGIGRSKIYGLIRQKKIPASRIGRQYRFSKSIVDAWLRENLIIAPENQIGLFSKP
jgi:excisionase family DNA binding protein